MWFQCSMEHLLRHLFNLKILFFQFITGIKFKWDYVMRCNIALLVCIGL